jgi:hypothetical protein
MRKNRQTSRGTPGAGWGAASGAAFGAASGAASGAVMRPRAAKLKIRRPKTMRRAAARNAAGAPLAE